MVYRRRTDALDSEWHFHAECPHWPALGHIQVRFVKPDQSGRICTHCIKLEAEMFPENTNVDSALGLPRRGSREPE